MRTDRLQNKCKKFLMESIQWFLLCQFKALGIQHRPTLYETSNQDTYLQLVPAPPKVLQKFLFRNINPDAIRKEELGSVRS
jgi:hypothetical protein